MVIVWEGNSERGAHVNSNICYLICLRHLNRSRAVTNRIFSEKKLFFQTCASYYESPSNICTICLLMHFSTLVGTLIPAADVKHASQFMAIISCLHYQQILLCILGKPQKKVLFFSGLANPLELSGHFFLVARPLSLPPLRGFPKFEAKSADMIKKCIILVYIILVVSLQSDGIWNVIVQAFMFFIWFLFGFYWL